ncbi:MAG: hypothetical protein LIO71_04590 [Ruminococcus sp.]|nr:hypothetical protein [Ruminococcus sp.]
MDLGELYDIALDMLSEKKSHGFGFNINDNSKISVLVTEDGSVFKATNGSTIQDGQLKNTCSEFEAITSMMKDNKTIIDYLVTLDIESGAFSLPCNSCMELMMQINPKNADAKIMTNVHDYTQLSNLLPSSVDSNSSSFNIQDDTNTIDDNDWLEGWGDSDTSTLSNDVNPFENTKPIANKNPFDSLPLFDDNPIPNKPDSTVKKSNTSYYQSRYLNATPNPVDASTSVNSVQVKNTTFKQQNNDITSRMRKDGLSESDKKDFNKQRLYNAFTTENVANVNGTQSSGTTSEVAEKQTLTKKELIKMAKEKKKMAKKDAKILENANKKR